MDSKQFHFRLRGVRLVLAALLVGFLWLLWDLQVVNGAYYRNQTVRKIAYSETVAAARGNILDRYGRILVTNRTTYQVTLDASFMGKEEQRNPNLMALLAICREEGVSWPDTLPISKTAPFTYTLDTASASAKSNFEAFVKRMGNSWQTARSQGADVLMAKMRDFFKVDPSVSDADARALVGVLYELRLRISTVDIVRTPYIFASDVDIDFISKVKEQGLRGVDIKAVTVREYKTPYAAHLLGRVGAIQNWDAYRDKGYSMNDTVGVSGLEQSFEEYLRGTPGVRIYETNASGKVTSESWKLDPETGEEMAPQPGANVVLTLDIGLQEVLERSLAENIPQLASEDTLGGAGVVIDVKNGGVLAMASYPSFDLANIYKSAALYSEVMNDPLNPMYNRATMGLYSPGSTFKMVTAVAGLEEGIITPSTIIKDTGVYTYYPDYQPACWDWRQYRRTHGNQNVTQALLNSCNVFFYDVGRRVGIYKLGEYADAFGLGRTTGLEIPEKSGAMASPEYTQSLGQTWYGGLTLMVAIGQGDSSFTPVQLANYVATLCTGGDHYAAHLLKEVKSSDFSQVLHRFEPDLLNSMSLSKSTLTAVKNGMLEVGNKYFSDLDVTVGAKTGSAQVASDLETDALFVCFAPFDDPEIAIALVVERGGGGKELAGIAADLMEYYFHAERSIEAVDRENALIR